MKKILIPIFIIITVFILSGCKKNSPAAPSTAKSVLYIYGADTAAAANFQAFINANGYSTTTVTVADASGVNFSSYGIIIVADDSATSSPWGSPALVTSIKNSAKPVLGICRGGALFFDAAGNTSIGYGLGSLGSGTSVAPVNSLDTIWSSPNYVTATANVTLYSSLNITLEEHYTLAPPPGTTLIGADVSNAVYFPLASSSTGGLMYFLWGFNSDPTIMTTAGQNLFINAMKSL